MFSRDGFGAAGGEGRGRCREYATTFLFDTYLWTENQEAQEFASELVVRIVEQYLADHREVFADGERLGDLIDCLDVFVRAGWPNAQALMLRLGEKWRQ